MIIEEKLIFVCLMNIICVSFFLCYMYCIVVKLYQSFVKFCNFSILETN